MRASRNGRRGPALELVARLLPQRPIHHARVAARQVLRATRRRPGAQIGDEPVVEKQRGRARRSRPSKTSTHAVVLRQPRMDCRKPEAIFTA